MTEDTDSYPLDDATLGIMEETLQQIEMLRAYREGALGLFIRQQKLPPGHWHLPDHAKELKRVDGRDRVHTPQSQRATAADPPSDLEQQLAASLNAAQDIKSLKRS